MVYAAILAGGRGTRMGGDLPKQYLPINGVPVMIHTVRKFLSCSFVDALVICVPRDYLAYTRELLATAPDVVAAGESVCVTEGGADRTASLENACRFFAQGREIGEDDILITHDCVRPYVTEELIADSVEKARIYGGATAAVPCVDTICVSHGGSVIDSVPNRAELFNVQTPQTFRMREFCDILYSLSDEEKRRVTDASAVFRLRGLTVALSAGSPSNTKITHPGDIR